MSVRARPGGRGRFRPGGAIVLGMLALEAAAAALPPSPYDILESRDLETPMLDAVPYCAPEGLPPAVDAVLDDADTAAWDAARDGLRDLTRGRFRADAALIVLEQVLTARAAADREARLEAARTLRDALRREDLGPHETCLRMELARLLMLLAREAEAAAQWTLAERSAERTDGAARHRDAIAFGRAEILYRTGRAFEAHLAFRRLARSERPRIAAAARLRLTDLSFDAGKSEPVTVEYEALLPRASAFGASTSGWALRAAEAALDAGELERGLRWIEHALESGPERDTRDAAEIRMADLDVAFEDPLRARKRLARISGRRHDDPIGTLAEVRAIALGVAAGSPDQQRERLLDAVGTQGRGVRRYALGVLMKQLVHRNDFDGALAVATRLAYEGVDPVVMPDYGATLDRLLERSTAGASDESRCRAVARSLSGRYGILIERASVIGPFVGLGECLERLELPWLATDVYRSVTRRFGAVGAEAVALPLARASLAVGEVALARRVAEASLESPDAGDRALAWRAVLAEVDFREGRLDEATRGLRAVLEAAERGEPRIGAWASLLARAVEERGDAATARFLAGKLPGWLQDPALPPRAEASLVEAALRTAHVERQLGQRVPAAALYRLVDRHARASALRSSARFWLGLAGERRADGSPAWHEDPAAALDAPWSGVARFERAIGPLAETYGEVVAVQGDSR